MVPLFQTFQRLKLTLAAHPTRFVTRLPCLCADLGACPSDQAGDDNLHDGALLV